MNDIKKRLEALEMAYKQDPLIVKCEDPEGKEHFLKMRDFIESNYTFKGVVSGSSLEDLDLLLQGIKEAAFRDAEADPEEREEGV